LQPCPAGPLPDADQAIRQLSSLLGAAPKLTLVVNDSQRDTPTTWVLDRLALQGLRPRARVLVATGSHRFPS
jgi:nickel-dependent lactate racemase